MFELSVGLVEFSEEVLVVYGASFVVGANVAEVGVFAVEVPFLCESPDGVGWAAFILEALDPSIRFRVVLYTIEKIYQLAPSSTVYGPLPSGFRPNVVCLTRPPTSLLYSMITKSSTEPLCNACYSTSIDDVL